MNCRRATHHAARQLCAGDADVPFLPASTRCRSPGPDRRRQRRCAAGALEMALCPVRAPQDQHGGDGDPIRSVVEQLALPAEGLKHAPA